MFIFGFDKIAFGIDHMTAGSMGGLVAGYQGGRKAAETTAGHLSQRGYKTRNEETAKTLAMLTAPAGAIAGLALIHKHKNKVMPLLRKYVSNHPDMDNIYHAAIPALAGIGGGLAGGAATGAAMSLRGQFSKKNKKHK